MPRSKSAEPDPAGETPQPPQPQRPPRPVVAEGFVAVGFVRTSFGLRGELKIEPLTPFPQRFAPGAALWLGGVERRVERSRRVERAVLLKLTGIDTPEAATAFRGQYLQIPESERLPLPADEFYCSDIIGLAVITTAGEALGEVAEFLPTGANDVVSVRGPRGEVLVPLIEDVVRQIDLTTRTMTIELLPGLMPEPPRPPRPRRIPNMRRRGRQS